MKKIIFISLSLLSIYACKKTKNAIDETNIETPIEQSDDYCKAKVNGGDFSADSYAYVSNVSNLGYFSFQSTAILAANSPAISISSKLQKGSFVIAKGTTNKAFYRFNNINYNAASGTINITEIDTVKTTILKIKATFEFNTDTVNGVSYQIKGGDLYYTN